MNLRYSYTATMTTAATVDSNGDPVAGTPVTFLCDYQPTVADTTVKYGGSFVNAKYKLFVSPTDTVVLVIGTEVTCNATTGIIVAVYPTKLNTEVWVK